MAVPSLTSTGATPTSTSTPAISTTTMDQIRAKQTRSAPEMPVKVSSETDDSLEHHTVDSVDSNEEFAGEVDTNDKIPSEELLHTVEGLVLLDKDGKTVPFKDLYNGPNVARRVLVIFIRHFFCGNCQEFVRTLAKSITPTELLQLPTPTFIAIVGCGDPSLIPMWIRETQCPFPCYADPTKNLYNSLGMLKTLSLGPRPEYQRQALVSLMTSAFVQSIKMIKSGKALRGGGYHQVGGEFMFEPVNMATPIASPAVGNDEGKQLGESDPNGDVGRGGYIEEKRVTWCHRMRTTRDHAEIPELREVLGLDGEGVAGRDARRWKTAVSERKGTGLSSRSSVRSSEGRPSTDKLVSS
ncbi:hypothetical protein BJ875DRAFT_66597 [Amylocarpus encephaloides]|uniref:Uncharacterized protein n=1 Tax=Amylocarpus encephaloides TaxID=45428 RepID=A0A9P7YFT4_9HELO|nr:hypothetical protein BJ875DRAFT_66597 [Amylocarpus encephaloides]